MTKIDKNWKAKEEAKRAFLSNQGMYAEEEEQQLMWCRSCCIN